MFYKSFTAATVALTASLVSAQTHTDCNPLEKSCKPDPAFGKEKVSCDFTGGECSDFTVFAGTKLDYSDKGAVFTINTATDAPTIGTGKYIFFGRVDVEVQAAAGKGIVTSAVLQSDDLDEIDWEWVGADNAQVQTNYYSKGQTETYDRGAFHPVSNPTGSFHTYSIEWTPTAITWSIDDKPVRTLEAANAHGVDGFPQTPMQVKLGTWVGGGPDSPEGTVEWAGGKTDFSQKPFLGYYKSISIVDYAGKDGPTSDSVKEYVYGDHSGNADSIKVVGGSNSDDSSSSSTTTTSSKSSTATTTKTHTKDHDSTTKATSTYTSLPVETEHSSAQTTSTAAAPTTVSTTTEAAPTGSSLAVQPSPTGSGATQNGVAAGIAAVAGAIMLAHLF